MKDIYWCGVFLFRTALLVTLQICEKCIKPKTVSIKSLFDDQNITIPLELEILNYNKTLAIDDPETVFCYSFNPNPLVIPLRETEESILTLYAKDNAPIGDYRMRLKIGNSKITKVCCVDFMVEVTSNPTPTPTPPTPRPSNPFPRPLRI